MSDTLNRIRELGQSVWCDYISRDAIESGMLKSMIEDAGISGVTSNPTIFQKAISGQKTYDHDIHAMVDEGQGVYQIYEGLVTKDIRAAADLLRPVFARTHGLDGYVSLEVPPDLAYERQETVAQVTRLAAAVDRPNLMIKVPATPQGIESVRELVAAGLSINVTLIFSLDQYRSTALAYIEGLEQWIASGGDPGKPASVASVFVSRVDTAVDERLNEIADPDLTTKHFKLLGKAAIANAKLIYALYRELFHGDRFAALKAKGARPQRVLWASTSTKNPAYPDTYYVDNLIGPETVNTMPPETLAAAKERSQPAPLLLERVEEASEVFARLEELGVGVSEVMEELLENGVKAFADSFNKLVDVIAQKRSRLLRGWGHRSASLGPLQERVDRLLQQYDEERASQRFWEGDPTLWTDDVQQHPGISERIGWLTIVEPMIGEIPRLKEFAEEVVQAGFTHAVLLGMGGSSLASEVFARCFGRAPGHLDLRVLDTTVPASVLALDRELDPERTLFLVSSKSGGTIEVVSLFKHFWARVEERLNAKAGANFIAITDPGTSLGKLASEKKFRRVFLNPPDIGGRFSALSYFGLVPAALLGVDLERLLMRASQATEAAGPDVPALENPGQWLGAIMGLAARQGKDKLTLILSPGIEAFGCWLEQLVAESTGKEGKGILPVGLEPVADPSNYGNDRLFIYLRLDDGGGYDIHVSALERLGHPVVTLRMHTPFDVGREMFRWEFATAVAGMVLRINPFDQPNVQESKDLTKRLLEAFGKDASMPHGDCVYADDPNLSEILREFMSGFHEGSYVALNAFLHPAKETVEALQNVREALLVKFRAPTTLGFGPRYLHSTGQLQKGGREDGRFIVISSDDAEDAQIPGEGYSFGVLKTAQAIGDYQALKAKGRKALRIHLRSDSQLRELVAAARSLG
ncbi:MAG: bifunctional transaldolase/phosoglucose isomerase [Thermodesulfobacteriota bacterium]